MIAFEQSSWIIFCLRIPTNDLLILGSWHTDGGDLARDFFVRGLGQLQLSRVHGRAAGEARAEVGLGRNRSRLKVPALRGQAEDLGQAGHEAPIL